MERKRSCDISFCLTDMEKKIDRVAYVTFSCMAFDREKKGEMFCLPSSSAACLSVFYHYFYAECSSERVNFIPLPSSCGPNAFDFLLTLTLNLSKCIMQESTSILFPLLVSWNTLLLSVFPTVYGFDFFRRGNSRCLSLR